MIFKIFWAWFYSFTYFRIFFRETFEYYESDRPNRHLDISINFYGQFLLNYLTIRLVFKPISQIVGFVHSLSYGHFHHSLTYHTRQFIARPLLRVFLYRQYCVYCLICLICLKFLTIIDSLHMITLSLFDLQHELNILYTYNIWINLWLSSLTNIVYMVDLRSHFHL